MQQTGQSRDNVLALTSQTEPRRTKDYFKCLELEADYKEKERRRQEAQRNAPLSRPQL